MECRDFTGGMRVLRSHDDGATTDAQNHARRRRSAEAGNFRIVTPFAERQPISGDGLPTVISAGLVKHHGIDLTDRFQRFSGTDEHTHLRSPTSGNRYGSGVANPNAHGHATGSTETAATNAYVTRGSGRTPEPQRARPDGDQHDNRHEACAACDAVGRTRFQAFELCADRRTP